MADTRKVVYLLNRCFLDDTHTRNYTDPRKLRDHLQDAHDYQFPLKIKSTRRYNNDRFLYLRHRDDSQLTSVNYACPCCKGHFKDTKELANHFLALHKVHLPGRHQQQNQHNQDTLTSAASGNDSHDDSETTSSTDASTQKRKLDETISIEGITFSLPDNDHLIVNNTNLSILFHQLQLSVIAKWKHCLEEHVHLALASTSVLLLTRNNVPNDISAFIGCDDWNATVDLIESKYGIKRDPMPLDVTNSLLAIVDDLLTKKINRGQANNKMDSLSLKVNHHKFARALGQLITKLPNQPMEEDFGEAELCSRFVEPFLSGLFDDPDNGVYLRWTNEATLETKFMFKSNGRPDLCITKSCGVKWATNVGYGEAKPASKDQDNHLICWDLLKVTIFCKEALDSQQMEGILGVQIIGRTIKFYVMTLPAKGLYTLIDLAVIKIPDSLQNFPGFVTEVANVTKVLDVFDRVCVPAKDVATTRSRRSSTLSMSMFHQLFTSAKDRKKPCHLKLRHN